MKKLLFFLAILLSSYIVKAQVVPVTDSVQLDCSQSNDPDGTIASFNFVQTSGGAITIIGAKTSKPLIVASAAGTFAFTETITDNDGGQKFGTFILTATASNILPNLIITINGVDVTNGTYKIKLK